MSSNQSQRIQKIISKLSSNLHEREEIIAVALLAAIAGKNTFLLGPPGTAKSLISRRIACAFENPKYFECLMNRFSTPEEIFGPISIKALKEDTYTRKTDGYLPTVDFAFLDEIWKSSPAILNNLLTIINERTFHNAGKTEKAPLKALISASNEIPPEGQGLEALYDRFIVRLFVPPMSGRDNFEALLNTEITTDTITLDKDLIISNQQWQQWQKGMDTVTLSEETLTVIHLIREKINKISKKNAVYVSDRRWKQATSLLKASAFLCGRKTTNLSDALLLRHCLWTTEQNHAEIIKIVEDSVRKSGLPTLIDLKQLDRKKDDLNRDIKDTFYHTEDIYDTVTLANGEYFKFDLPLQHSCRHYCSHDSVFYVPKKNIKTKNEFNPIDKNGNELTDLACSFDGQETVNLECVRYNRSIKKYTPKILFHKGDKKVVPNRTKEDYKNHVTAMKQDLVETQQLIEDEQQRIKATLEIPFVPENIRNIAYEGISQQIDDLSARIKDCDLLFDKIG